MNIELKNKLLFLARSQLAAQTINKWLNSESQLSHLHNEELDSWLSGSLWGLDSMVLDSEDDRISRHGKQMAAALGLCSTYLLHTDSTALHSTILK